MLNSVRTNGAGMFRISSSRRVQSVQTAFRIIHFLQDRNSATKSQLVEELDIASSTLHNYLGTLEEEGYIVNRDGTYSLGLRFLTHGMAARNNLHVGYRIRDVLASLSQDLFLPAWWIVEELGRGIFVERTLPEDGQEVYGQVGKRSHLHTHAPGKAILAQSSPTYVEKVLDRHGLPAYTAETTTDQGAFLAEIERVRDRGFAVSRDETALGVHSIGKAFEDTHGTIHALGAFGHSHEFRNSSIENEMSSMLGDAVAEIKRSIDGREE